MVTKILLTLLLLSLSGLFYRLGGIGKPFKSWMRDWVCPLWGYLSLLVWWQPSTVLGWLMFIPAYGLSGGALSTYWDELFGYDNFYMHGFMCGIASFPLIFAGIAWRSVLLSGVVGGVLMGLLCQLFSDVWVEEGGRGVIFAMSKTILRG